MRFLRRRESRPQPETCRACDAKDDIIRFLQEELRMQRLRYEEESRLIRDQLLEMLGRTSATSESVATTEEPEAEASPEEVELEESDHSQTVMAARAQRELREVLRRTGLPADSVGAVQDIPG